MNSFRSLEDLVDAARRRMTAQVVLEQAGWGVAAGLFGFLVLLVVGTQVLAVQWLLLPLAVAALIGWLRTRGKRPSSYLAAQRLDAGLRSRDLLSTAYHFTHGTPRHQPDAVFVERVREQAETAAAQSEPEQALPLRFTRGAQVAALMFLLASGGFVLRYGVLHTFDLRAPLAVVRFDTMTGAPQPPKDAAEMARRRGMPEPYSFQVPDSEGSQVTERSATQEEIRDESGDSPSQASESGKRGEKKVGSSEAGDKEGESVPGAEDRGSERKGDSNNASPDSGSGKQGDRGARQKAGQQPKESSLMDKMRDALANLMDKFNMEPKGGEGKRSEASQNRQPGQQKSDRSNAQQGKDNQPSDSDSQQPGQQQGESDSSQQARSQQNGPESQNRPEQDKSGAGRQDGRKDTELAEEQAALGKLSELMGRRALNLQGEAMVEVNNSKNQQLKTPFVNRNAAHAEAGGEITRDEVPLESQEFVKRYYESVRKQTPPSAPKTAKP
jgi:hypothetical protein